MRIKQEELAQLEWEPEDGRALGEFLRLRRESLNLSLREMRIMTGVSEGNLSQIEQGIRVRSSFWTIAKLFIVLGLSLDEYFRAEREMYEDTLFFKKLQEGKFSGELQDHYLDS